MFRERKEIKEYLNTIEKIVYNRFVGYIGKQKYHIVGNNVWYWNDKDKKLKRTNKLFTEMDRIVEMKRR